MFRTRTCFCWFCTALATLLAAYFLLGAPQRASAQPKGPVSFINDVAPIFKENCSGCHTLSVAGTQGSTTNIRTREYKDGPNFDQRKVTYNCALYAIRNGGFSSGPMPQDIVVGAEAEAIAKFLAEESGSQVHLAPGATQPPDCPPPA